MPHAAPKYTNLHIIHHHTPLNTMQNSHSCYQLRPFLNRCCICYALESSLTICYTIYNRDTPRYLEIIPPNIPPTTNLHHYNLHIIHHHPLEHRAEFSLTLPVTNRYDLKYPRESSFTISIMIFDRDTPRSHQIISRNTPPSPTHQPPL